MSQLHFPAYIFLIIQAHFKLILVERINFIQQKMLALGKYLKFSKVASLMKTQIFNLQLNRMFSESIKNFDVKAGPKTIEFYHEKAKLTVTSVDRKTMRENFENQLNGYFIFKFTPVSERKFNTSLYDEAFSMAVRVSSKKVLLFMNIGEENSILRNVDQFVIRNIRDHKREFGISVKKLPNNSYQFTYFNIGYFGIKHSIISLELNSTNIFILKAMLRNFLPRACGWNEDVDFQRELQGIHSLPLTYVAKLNCSTEKK